MIKITTVIISLLLFSGCVPVNNSIVKKEPSEPKWLQDPYLENDKIAATGCAKRHFKGISAQKDLAVSRAIDRIATQNSVIVDNVTLRKKSVSNGIRETSSASSSSLQTINNVKISTKNKAFYTKADGEICVWVVQR